MNIRTGLKTLAVALPMAVTPVKSCAQTVAKAEKTVAHDAMKINGGIGIGGEVTHFFNQLIIEPKLAGDVRFSTYNMKGKLGVSAGRTVQTLDARIAYPVRFKDPKLTMDIGGYYNVQHISKNRGIAPVTLKNELKDGPVSLYRGSSTIGFYAEPKYALSEKVNISAKAEVGNCSLSEKGEIPDKSCILDNSLIHDVKQSGVVSNVALGAEYKIHPKINLGGNVNYSTLHKKVGLNIESKVNF
jgi:hypothetical protein